MTENDLNQLKDVINSQNQKLETLIDNLTEIKLSQIRLEENQKSLTNQLSDYKEQSSKRLDDVINRINDTNNRLNTMTTGFLTIVGILVTGLLGIIAKIVFFPTI